jgi:Ca-activated chloride channel family protein
VLDASASVAGQPLRELSNAARIAADALGSSDRISLLTFTHRVSLAAQLSTDRGPILAAIEGMRAAGATSLFDAVYAALVLRSGATSRALVIAFTDGYDSSSWLPPSAVLHVAEQTDAVVYGVTLAPREPARAPSFSRLGSDVLTGRAVVSTALPTDEPPAFLDEISSITGGRVFHTANPQKLGDLFRQAVREMKSRYVLSYTPRGIERGGWHSLAVKLTRRTGDVTARRGYYVAPGR